MTSIVHANIDATIGGGGVGDESVRHVDSDDALCDGSNTVTGFSAMDECAHVPVAEWRAHHVHAWLTYEIGTSAVDERQRRSIADNIKSGKVLLALSDADLQTTIGISHPLMVRKVRAAIEELRAQDKVYVFTFTQIVVH